MNCKPGDLAIVVSGRPASNHGRVIKVLHVDTYFGCQYWTFEGDLGGCHWIDDSCLRPIRNPGDDAQDEALQWLPVPSQHKEVA